MIDAERRSANRAYTNYVSEVRGCALIESYASNLPIVVIQHDIRQRAKVPGHIGDLALEHVTDPTQKVERVTRGTTQRTVKREV